MARNIVICCDGTNNEFGKVNTNVVRLVQVLDRNQIRQRLYYDPGVGTLPEPGFVSRLGKKISEIMGLAFGAGLTWKVEEAYSFLMDIWEPGDRVFLFGFSRGAYSARVLAGLLHSFGLLPRGNQNLVPYMMRLYAGARDERKQRQGELGPWQDLCNSFRQTFARAVFEGDNDRHFPVHFLGVWDTVSSVGWVWNPDKFPYTANNPSIKIARHAVSLDERRSFFRQNLIKEAPDQDWKEYWFPGVHCDVGGGYPDIYSDKPSVTYAGLWRNSFLWMVQEAKACGLSIDEIRLKEVTSRSPPCEFPWKEQQHESLTRPWWIAEIVPKRIWDSKLKRLIWQCGLGRHRVVPSGSLIHQTTLLRIRDYNYGPPNLSPEFLATVKAMDCVPDVLRYELPT
jgi:uncharacterized protein (DUF2235 family)